MPDAFKCAEARAQVRRQKTEFKAKRKLQKECGKPFGRGHAYKQLRSGWQCVCCDYTVYHSPFVWQVVERLEEE